MIDGPPHVLGEGLDALKASGLLFALNKFVLHGRGFEVSVEGDSLLIRGDGSRVLEFDAPAEAIDDAWRAFRQTEYDAQTKCRPVKNERSPGFGVR